MTSAPILITPQSVLQDSTLIVIKVGSVLVRGHKMDQVNQKWMDAFAEDITSLKKQGKQVVIVSSGGVALGRRALDIAEDTPPNAIPLARKQAASAVGQYHLFHGYFQAFQKQGITAAQVLLTMSETESRRMSINARDTLRKLLKFNIVPVINENDTVSTGEIRFGDNDRLAVRVAQMIMADCVVLLSTADGLYTDNPHANPNAEHIPVIEKITQKHVDMAGDAVAGLSTGGMKSKIEAAQSAVKAGMHMVMTEGREDHALINLMQDTKKSASLFIAQDVCPNARKIWIGAHMNPRGIITIDNGAASALQSGKSLLPVGVVDVSGDFRRGDIVEIKAVDGTVLGKGICAYKAKYAKRIKGKHCGDEVTAALGFRGRDELIHRNDMVLET